MLYNYNTDLDQEYIVVKHFFSNNLYIKYLTSAMHWRLKKNTVTCSLPLKKVIWCRRQMDLELLKHRTVMDVICPVLQRFQRLGEIISDVKYGSRILETFIW